MAIEMFANMMPDIFKAAPTPVPKWPLPRPKLPPTTVSKPDYTVEDPDPIPEPGPEPEPEEPRGLPSQHFTEIPEASREERRRFVDELRRGGAGR